MYRKKVKFLVLKGAFTISEKLEVALMATIVFIIGRPDLNCKSWYIRATVARVPYM